MDVLLHLHAARAAVDRSSVDPRIGRRTSELPKPARSAWFAGSVAPDLARIRGPSPAGPWFDAGVALHRRIDGWADADPTFHDIRLALRPAVGRYAAIVADIALDHLYAHVLPADTDRTTQLCRPALHDPPDALPPALRDALARLAQHDEPWRKGPDAALARHLTHTSRYLARRFDRPVDLTPAARVVNEHRDRWGPDVKAFVRRLQDLARSAPLPSPDDDPSDNLAAPR